MARIVKSIEIDAPNEHVFALALDFSRQPEWTTFIKEALVTSGDGKSAGTTDRSVIKVGPRASESEGEWTEYKPGEIFARRSSGGMSMEERMTFTPAGGGTRVEWAVEYKPPMGPLGALMDVFMMNRVFQNELEASLANLKVALET
jgi:uncharacterized membrane protein